MRSRAENTMGNKKGRSHSNKTKTSSKRPETSKEVLENIRLNKYIANAGVCSRREADKLIEKGDITVNGDTVTEMGHKVSDSDDVRYLGKRLKKERYKYILLNKPKNYITTVSDTHDRQTVMELIEGACSERVYPVGRLDRNTTGLLLFTNDGELTKRLTHPSYEVKKIYEAVLDKPLEEDDLEKLTEGVELEDGTSVFDSAEYNGAPGQKTIVMVSIHSGKNRIVRRMFEELNYEVIKLDRIEFAGLKKGKVTRGKWRILDKKEVGFLKTSK